MSDWFDGGKFHMDKYEDHILEISNMPKQKLYKYFMEESAGGSMQLMNFKGEFPFHFVSSVYENKTITKRKSAFFSKKLELNIDITHKQFTEYEKKYRQLIFSEPLLTSDIVDDFISSIVNNKTVKKRIEYFYTIERDKDTISKKDFTILEKRHREFVLENKDSNREKLVEELLKLDKRPIVIKIKDIELNENYQRIKKYSNEIKTKRAKKSESTFFKQTPKGSFCPNCKKQNSVRIMEGGGILFLIILFISVIGILFIPFLPRSWKCQSCGNQWK
jgi:hypothetical protein